MRIAYITETHPPELNGVSLTAQRTVRFLRERGHEVDLIRPRQPHEPAHNDATEWRTRGLPLPMYPDLRWGLARVAHLRQRFQQHRPDVVHMATPGPLAWAAMRAARALQIPASTDFRTNFHIYSHDDRLSWLSPLILKVLRGFHNQGQRTFVPTPAVKQALAAQGFERLEVVACGVDTQDFSPLLHGPALRDELAHPDGPLLLYVGRLAAAKNVGLALQAYESVRAGMPQASMVVVGDGPQRAALERAHPHVQFVGVLRGEALARHYACADLFLFPSLTDTFGHVVPEALASGVPVLAFDTGAAAMLVRDTGAGRVVPAGDSEHFIAAACSLAWQYRHLGQMRERARLVALKHRWDQVLTPFENRLLEMAHAIDPARVRQTRAA